jgi:hypothetical protein
MATCESLWDIHVEHAGTLAASAPCLKLLCRNFGLRYLRAFNGFSAWLFFGGEGMITDSAPQDQEKRIKYKEVIANAVVLQNVVDMTHVLHELSAEGFDISREMVAALSPYLTRNIKRFGDYTLDMTLPPQPFQAELPVLR